MFSPNQDSKSLGYSLVKSSSHDANQFGWDCICQCVTDHSVNQLKEKLASSSNGGDLELKKVAVDQAFRDELLNIVCNGQPASVYIDLLTVATEAAQNDICPTSTLFIMMSDLFDTISLEKCNEVFKFLEDRVSLWKQDLLYNAGKNYLLRMCNDLLRRLSKSQDTVFSGRIQVFLARLFPLEEKSGLNLMSQFNIENITIFNTKSEDETAFKPVTDAKESGMDIEEGEMDDTSGASIPVDYILYRKFWSLQDFFRRPTQCYEKFAWKTFTNCSDDVLRCFSSYKLDDIKISQQKPEDQPLYFAKYLTSEKLLDLQLSDSNFRRNVLVQFLILFQYLNSQVKFKTSTQILTEDQTAWIKNANERVLKILSETPPDGEQFTETVKHILGREEEWNAWKNESCPSYLRKPEPAKPLPRPRKRAMGDDLKATGFKVKKMGNSELTRLWNLCPDNMLACKSEKRNYLPPLQDFFEVAVEQADPAAGIEEQYKVVNDLTYGWKALRLLAQKSPHFFGQAPVGQQAAAYKRVPDYLNFIVGKMVKELPTSAAANDVKVEQEETAVTSTNADDAIDDGGTGKEDTTSSNNDDDRGSNENGESGDIADAAGSDETPPSGTNKQLAASEKGASPGVSSLSVDTLVAVANRLKAGLWKSLAVKLNFQQDEIAYFESEAATDPERGIKMLTIWKENEGSNATAAVLKQKLIEITQQPPSTEN